MNDAQLARLLTERNSWWANPEWERDDPDLRPLRATPFTYRPKPLRGITPGGLYLLLGPRRVGKTVELKRAVEALPFSAGERLPVKLSISAGAAVFPGDGQTYDVLLQEADSRMYKDKAAGHSRGGA